MNVPAVYVNEVFESIQGEGLLAGYRTLFVRFQICHVGCRWCDTKYTWKKAPKYAWKSVDFLQHILEEVDKRDIWIDFTGGEPLEQFESMRWLIGKLNTNGCSKISIETSGTPMPDRRDVLDLFNGEVFWSLSPKLSSAIGKRFSHEGLLKICSFWNEAIYVPYRLQFKFVVSTVQDLEEIESLLVKLDTPHPVILQVEHSKINDRGFIQKCVDFTKARPDIRVTIQQHRVLQVE